MTEIIIDTSYGKVRGQIEGNMRTFKGISYAEPPIGKLRFLPPRSCKPWDGVRDCLRYGRCAVQAYDPNLPSSFLDGETPPSEDCLYLNVFVPQGGSSKKPVLYYVHGGAYRKNSATAIVNPVVFAEKDIIVVSGNFRIGVLGFLDVSGYLGSEYISSGNNGLLDVIKALEWVRDNIAAFGGDPENVSVMGLSSGAKMVSTLSVMKSAKGLYKKLICESGGLHTIRDKKTAYAVAERFMTAAGLGASDGDKLLELSKETLVECQKEILPGLNLHSLGPVADGVQIMSTDWRACILNGQANPTTILCGTNRDEMMLYWFAYKVQSLNMEIAERLFGRNAEIVLCEYEKLPPKDSPDYRDAFIAFITEYIYRYGTYSMAESFSKAGEKVFLFRNDWDKRKMKAVHCATLCFVMRNHKVFPENTDTPEYLKMEDLLIDAFCSFIRDGTPRSSELPDWPAFNEDGKMMVFNEHCEVMPAPKPSVAKDWPDNVFCL